MLFKKFAVLTLAFAPLMTLAQPPGPRMPDMEKLTILLELDAYQQSEVERILQAQRETMRSRFDNEAGERPSREEMRATREAARADVLTQLQSVLTASQIEKFEVLTQRPARGRRGEGRRQDQDL